MGAKQSKRSVDISGKEAEGGGEVAAAGAGGEGRVEALADVDALKPQLNGDAHIQTEQTNKEKELDVGTPENEKDATTEKESKEENEKENEVAPVTNGDAEEKLENGESTPAPEDGKKPKKEKVKKKWSLRSISFSRKDKPKQEKKQKDEEIKTNGEPEKVLEETAEAAAAEPAEAAAEEVATEAVTSALAVATKTEPEPESAVAAVDAAETAAATLINGGASPSVPDPAEEAPAPAPTPAEPEPAPAPATATAPISEPEPEQLPVNGLSLEELKPEVPEEKIDESKPEPPAAETVEIAPAPEIPVKEVCVQQMPLLESTPPPLPANPPPSSVASFAATTMAPEHADPPMSNTAATAAEPLSALPDTQPSTDQVQVPDISLPVTSVSDATELPSPIKEPSEYIPLVADAIEPELPTEIIDELPKADELEMPSEVEVVPTAEQVKLEDVPVIANVQIKPSQAEEIKEQLDEIADANEGNSESIPEEAPVIESNPESKMEETPEPKVEQTLEPNVEQTPDLEIEQIPEPEVTTSEIDDTPLPPPPAQDDFETESNIEQNGEDDIKMIPEPIAEPVIIDSNHVSVSELTNGVDEISLEEKSVSAENAKNKAKAVVAPAPTENGVDKMECNGVVGCREVIVTGPTSEEKEAAAAATYSPLTSPAALTPQEPVSVSDKLGDLIPEVPEVPEINTETLQVTATDLAVTN